MVKYYMARGKVTESYNDMFAAGERDVSTIIKIVTKFDYNDGDMNIDIVSHANNAVEKFLKGYLIKNNIEVTKIHELDTLYGMTIKKNDDFKEIQEECYKLDRFGAGVKYDPMLKVNSYVANESVKSLEKIYNFDEIKKIRNELKETNKEYPKEEYKLGDIINNE